MKLETKTTTQVIMTVQEAHALMEVLGETNDGELLRGGVEPKLIHLTQRIYDGYSDVIEEAYNNDTNTQRTSGVTRGHRKPG